MIIRKQIVLLFLFITCSFLSAQTLAQEPNDSEGEIRFISDDLFTYLHAGPGRNFRILGSVVAGTRVTLLQEDTEKNFVEIIDDKQRTGWVDAEFISVSSSVRELVPGLQQQVQSAEQTIQQQRQSNDLLNQQIADLTSQNSNLKKKLSDAEKENLKITQTLADYDQTAQMEWFTRGGIVAVISLLLGIVLTYLPKKRRRNDNWM
ncbi:TIGR04211 family SH3 domain-containing protein [Paraglaciecola arctica]|uniref:TIGR04211 family SH3 domain-containing protein n=1 Tax=Paraglaciecola arctica TaxID=1128911 RepID=UPI001C067FFE|nr:TIGR04211 family SH3 domain-containing protein [Paraglaciecola arctica]MBU3002348.1 TIGR04211 family SH3 domain-containing protein [Paraglaciecola arctica]